MCCYTEEETHKHTQHLYVLVASYVEKSYLGFFVILSLIQDPVREKKQNLFYVSFALLHTCGWLRESVCVCVRMEFITAY